MVDPGFQQWNARDYQQNASFVPRLGMDLLDCLKPRPHERILDLGCGDGTLTEELRRLGCSVIGVDASAQMIAATRERGLEAVQMDGQALTFDTQFDAVFSNAALHWMLRPEQVLAGVFRALKPGGRLVAEMGGSGNVERIVTALDLSLEQHGYRVDNPWFFPTPVHYQALLEEAGFVADHLRLFERPTELPGTMADWLSTFAHSWLQALPANEHEQFIARVLARLEPQLMDTNGLWRADYVRLRVVAVKPAQ